MNATDLPLIPGVSLQQRRGRQIAYVVSLGGGRKAVFTIRGSRAETYRAAVARRAEVEARRSAARPVVDLSLVEEQPERGIRHVTWSCPRRSGGDCVLHYYAVADRRAHCTRVRICAGQELLALEAARALRRRVLAGRRPNRKGARP